MGQIPFFPHLPTRAGVPRPRIKPPAWGGYGKMADTVRRNCDTLGLPYPVVLFPFFGPTNVLRNLGSGGAKYDATLQAGGGGWVLKNSIWGFNFTGADTQHFLFANPLVLSSSNWTISWESDTDGSANDGVFLGTAGTTNDYLWFREAQYFRFKDSTGGENDHLTGGKTFTGFARWCVQPTAAAAGLYRNGELYSSDATPLGTVPFSINSIGYAYTSSSYAYDGRIYWLAIWNGITFNARMIRADYEAGYLYIAHRPAPVFFDVGAEPPTSSIPVFAHHYKQQAAA